MTISCVMPYDSVGYNSGSGVVLNLTVVSRAGKLGSPNRLKESLVDMVTKDLAQINQQGKTDYKINSKRIKEYVKATTPQLTKTLNRMEKISSGRLQIRGTSESYLREDGTIEKFCWRNPKTGHRERAPMSQLYWQKALNRMKYSTKTKLAAR